MLRHSAIEICTHCEECRHMSQFICRKKGKILDLITAGRNFHNCPFYEERL